MNMFTSWTAAHAAVLIPFVFFLLTALFKGPNPARLAAAQGAARVGLVLWADGVELLNATGVSAPMLFAWVKKRFFTPKPPSLPPPLPPAPMPSKDVLSGEDIAFDDDTLPSVQTPVPAKSIPPLAAAHARLRRVLALVSAPILRVHRGPGSWSEGLLAAASVFLVWSGFAALALACGSLASTVQTYAPHPADELGIVSYGGAQEECLALDASKAEKVACVHAVRCAAGREDAGSCSDAGSDAGSSALAACLADGGIYACTSNTDCTCAAKPSLDAPSDGAAAHALLVHQTNLRAESK